MKTGKQIFGGLLAIVMLFTVFSATALAADKTITVDDDGTGDYTTIQAAIDYVAGQSDPTGWTIEVKDGTYDRFTVPHWNKSGIVDLTIVGESEDGVIVDVLNEAYTESNLIDNGGINIYGTDVTLKNMTIKAGTVKQAWDDAAISTNHGMSGGMDVSLTVENCTLIGPGIDNGATYGVFWACSGMNVVGCNISGFANAIEYMNDGFNIPAGETYYFTDNVITGSSFAIHGYMGGGNGGGILKIANNTVTGTDDLRSKIICQDNVEKSFVVDIRNNELTNALIGLVNLQDSGDVLHDVLDNNIFAKNSYYVEAIEPGTIEFYTTYYAPDKADGQWVVTGIDDFDVDWGKNPDGSTAYIQDVVDKANAEGSRTLSITGIDADNLIKTFTWFKDGIYWVGENDKTSYPGIEKWINVGDTDNDGVDNWVEANTIAAGETVDFVLKSNVPEDLTNYLEADDVDAPTTYAFDSEVNGGRYLLTFHDVMDSNLTLDEESIVVAINGVELPLAYYTVTVPGTDCKVDGEGGCTFEVALNNLVEIYNVVDENGEHVYFDEDDLGTASIVVTYKATTSTGLKPGEYLNTAWVEYEGGNTEEDTVEVETFGIKIFKYDQANDEGLYGASFELYAADVDYIKWTDWTDDMNDKYDHVIMSDTIDTWICLAKGNLVATLESGADGYVSLEGLDAGYYFLKETKAPEGYVMSTDDILIEIPDDANESNIVNVKFANAEIPHTGGNGTAMYTIGGIAILLAAGALFVISRKKKTCQ